MIGYEITDTKFLYTGVCISMRLWARITTTIYLCFFYFGDVLISEKIEYKIMMWVWFNMFISSGTKVLYFMLFGILQ